MMVIVLDIAIKDMLLIQLNNNKRLEKPENCSEDCYDIMQDCWKKDPAARPNFTEIKRRVDQLKWRLFIALKVYTAQDATCLQTERTPNISATQSCHYGRFWEKGNII